MKYNDLFDFIYSESSYSVVPTNCDSVTVEAKFGETTASATRRFEQKENIRENYFYILMQCECVAEIIDVLIPKYEKHFGECSI